MDFPSEASDGPISEAEVSGVVSEEELAKQLQAVAIGNQECEDLPRNLKDSQSNDITCSLKDQTMGSGESKCEAQTNVACIVNGVSEEEVASEGSTTGVDNNNVFAVLGDAQEPETEQDNSDGERDYEVSELVNEILNESSYVEECSLNGVSENVPEEENNSETDSTARHSSQVIYFNIKEENGSSLDSDSNMATASEGSSTPTSELSASSSSSDHQNFINIQDTKELSELLISGHLTTSTSTSVSPTEDLTNGCNPEVLVEVDISECKNNIDIQEVKEFVLNNEVSLLPAVESVTNTDDSLRSLENGSLEVAVDDVDAITEINSQFNISYEEAEKPTEINNCHSVADFTSDKEIVVSEKNSENGLDVAAEPEIQDMEKVQRKTINSLDTDTQSVTETTENLLEPVLTEHINEIRESEDINRETSDSLRLAYFHSIEGEDEDEDFLDMAHQKLGRIDVNLPEVEYGEKRYVSEPEIVSDQNANKYMSCTPEEVKQDEGFEELEKSYSETAISDPGKDSEPEDESDRNDIKQVVAALETLSLSAEEPGDIQENIESVTVVSSNFENKSIINENDMLLNNECETKVDCEIDRLEHVQDITGDETSEKEIVSHGSCVNSKDESLSSEYDCTCRRNETAEEGSSVMVGVWAELRSSLRQLHRAMIPQSSQLQNQRSRPSINRIKALANMLVSHDAHQLYLRISHLAHEFCIELKVRLLATIHDNPTPKEATAFIQGICDSYQSVMNVCEALHPALEHLDTEHLSRFKLNWVTVNMHVFHSTIVTDPDVLEYVQNCKEKLNETPGGDDVLNCLASLHRTLAVAEAVWVRADTLLQEYAIERAALSARRRQLLADWEQFKAQQRTQQQQMIAKAGTPNSVSPTTLDEDGGAQCPCDECVGSQTEQREGQTSSGNVHAPLSTTGDIRSGSNCECHFCNASVPRPTSEEPVLPPSSGSSLPPLAQPQLSLYPHIHNTPPGSDIVGSGQSREELGPVPPAPTTKPPITTNPYLGSDLLTEQLMREWELVYGDALTPPGSHPILPPPDGIMQSYESDPSSLVSGVETMRVSSSRPSYTRTMVDPSMPYVPDSCATARAHTTILPSSQSSASTVNHTVSSASTVAKVPVSSRSSTPSCEGSSPTTMPDLIDSGKSCCSSSNATSVITHTRAHTQTTAAVQKGEMERRAGEELSNKEECESASTTHQEPHCDCCYCHMLHHKQGDGRQKYNERRERLLKILSRKKSAHNSAACNNTTANAPATCVGAEVPTSKAEGTPIGGQNIDKIMEFIEGNQTDEAKRARKAAKKARQKQRKREEKEAEEKRKLEKQTGQCEEEEEVEDGPLAELRRRAPDVTITVVRPGQQTSRTPPAPQVAFQRPRDPSPPAMEVYKPPPAKLVPSLAQSPGEQTPPPQSSSRTILHPSRHSVYGRQPPAQQGKNFPVAPLSVTGNEATIADRPVSGKGESGGLSNILKAMDAPGKEKDKGSQMVTIRRVMDPNSAEPTVTITLKGEQPEEDKVLFKLVNGQAVAGNGGSGQNGKKGGKKNHWSEAKTIEPTVPEGLNPEELKKLKKKQKKERQRLQKQQDRIEEREVGHLQQLEIQKQQEFLRQQQEQIHQQQLALQRQQEALIKQQQQQKQQTQNNNTKGNKNKKKKEGKNAANKNSGVSAVVYDGDNMAPSFNLPPGVTINKVAGQPGMVTISNNMGGAFSQPFLPNPNIYPSPVVHGFPMSVPNNSQLPSSYSGSRTSGLSWNSAIDKSVNYPDKDNVIVVDTNKSFMATKSKPKKKRSEAKKVEVVVPERELSSEEKIEMALKGQLDPNSLNATQKKKYKKMKKAMDEQEEEERRQQQEEDELMDKMYHLAMGTWTRGKDKNQTQGKKQGKKNQKENNSKQVQQTNNNKSNSQQTSKANKQQKKQDNQQQKQKQNKTVEQNTKNSNKSSKDNTLKNITNHPKKEISSNGKTKNKKQAHQEEKYDTSQQKQGQKKTQQQQKQSQNQKHNHQQEQKTQQKQKQHEQEKQHQKGKQKHSQEKQDKLNKVEVSNHGNFSKRLGYDPQDIAHEARYAQYLAANANTLAKMTYNTYNGSVKEQHDDEKHATKKKMKKRGKKGNLEDMMIDSVFTPKDVAEGELDETERDVEAFKRFCFNNVPLHSGEKPKVNFNVKDIMIKKRPCNGNL